MKSSTKANPPAEAWNPPDLDGDAVEPDSHFQKEKIIAIFQNDLAPEKVSAEPDKKITTWQPDFLDHQAAAMNQPEWSFLDVTDTPFDRSWTPQAPSTNGTGASRQERSASEKEATSILERARLQAEEIILAAQSEADNVLQQAQTEIDEQKKEGYQQGWQEARTEAENSVRAAHSLVQEMETWKTEFIAGSEEILVEMLKDISRKMFGEGAKLDRQALHHNLNRILENARGLGPLKIFMNPEDAKLLDPYWSEQQMLILGEPVKVVASSNVAPGGCLIKGNMGTVDARVETQLATILKNFDDVEESAE